MIRAMLRAALQVATQATRDAARSYARYVRISYYGLRHGFAQQRLEQYDECRDRARADVEYWLQQITDEIEEAQGG